MNDRPADLDPAAERELMRAAVADEAQAQAADEHPPVDTLVDYFRGHLDPAAEDAIQEHLTLCPECSAAALDLADLAAATETAAHNDTSAPADLAGAAAWRRLRETVGDLDSEPPAVADRSGGGPRWLTATAAALALATIGLGLWNLDLRRSAEEREHLLARLERPHPNLPTVYLEPYGSERGTDAWLQDFAAEDAYLLLVLTPEALDGRSYELIIRPAAPDEAGGEAEPLATAGALELSDHGTVRLLVRRSLLPPGDYRLALEARHAARTWPAGDYRLRIR